MEKITEYITSFISPNKNEMNAFLTSLEIKRIKKNERIQKQNIICNQILFVNEGFIKYSMFLKEKEKVISLASEGDLVSDFFSFYSGQPAIVNITTITDCEMLVINKSNLEKLYAEHKVWERFGRLVAQQAFLSQVMQKIDFQTKTPQEMYLQLFQTNKDMFQHVKLGDIAASLGISQETLSRIRGRI